MPTAVCNQITVRSMCHVLPVVAFDSCRLHVFTAFAVDQLIK